MVCEWHHRIYFYSTEHCVDPVQKYWHSGRLVCEDWKMVFRGHRWLYVRDVICLMEPLSETRIKALTERNNGESSVGASQWTANLFFLGFY